MFKKNKKKRNPEDEKIFLMWTGVCFFMILIVSLWFFNMKNIFSDIDVKGEPTGLDINTMTENFEKSMSQIKDRFDEVGETVIDTVGDDLNKN